MLDDWAHAVETNRAASLMAPRTPYNMLLRPPRLQRLPARSNALLLLDVQHYTVSPDRGLGAEATLRGISREFAEYREQAAAALRNIARLLAAFRAHGAPIVHALLADTGPGLSRQLRDAQLPLPPAAALEVEFVDEARPLPGEIVFARGCYSPFLDGRLQPALDGIERLMICGMMANLTVVQAAREAADRGFSVIVVQDCCAAETHDWHGLAMLGVGGGAIRARWCNDVIDMLAGVRT
jgi:nicotinamidase-related amidase